MTKKKVSWQLTDERINDIQVDSIDRLIARAKNAHFVDVRVRINGKDELFQADWLKHLQRIRRRLPWWQRLLCALDGHGGVVPADGSHVYTADQKLLCKRCGGITRSI